jgi:hypothetical protein
MRGKEQSLAATRQPNARAIGSSELAGWQVGATQLSIPCSWAIPHGYIWMLECALQLACAALPFATALGIDLKREEW